MFCPAVVTHIVMCIFHFQTSPKVEIKLASRLIHDANSKELMDVDERRRRTSINRCCQQRMKLLFRDETAMR